MKLKTMAIMSIGFFWLVDAKAAEPYLQELQAMVGEPVPIMEADDAAFIGCQMYDLHRVIPVAVGRDDRLEKIVVRGKGAGEMPKFGIAVRHIQHDGAEVARVFLSGHEDYTILNEQATGATAEYLKRLGFPLEIADERARNLIDSHVVTDAGEREKARFKIIDSRRVVDASVEMTLEESVRRSMTTAEYEKVFAAQDASENLVAEERIPVSSKPKVEGAARARFIGRVGQHFGYPIGPCFAGLRSEGMGINPKVLIPAHP
ncbi:MAG: hypothetical protein HY459_00885 [Parcubacteria group bacterium]|nr:hypothetical protein [Parcubacteria group bacterium]